mmetsp:Transcript_15664/g.39050  ORF Transcript_15664/g.39050 Transcript_15664/m.39050 type:complete len:138 (+) Transcript_15664:1639-2052(+)
MVAGAVHHHPMIVVYAVVGLGLVVADYSVLSVTRSLSTSSINNNNSNHPRRMNNKTKRTLKTRDLRMNKSPPHPPSTQFLWLCSSRRTDDLHSKLTAGQTVNLCNRHILGRDKQQCTTPPLLLAIINFPTKMKRKLY